MWVTIYSKDGEFVRSVKIQNSPDFFEIEGITLKNDGTIAVIISGYPRGKVVVL